MPTENCGDDVAGIVPSLSKIDGNRSLRHGLLILLLAAFFVDLAASMSGLAVQFLGIKLDASTVLLGLYGTVGSTVYAVGCYFAGRTSDRFGRKLSALFLCLAGIMWMWSGLQRSPYAILVLVPLGSACLAFFWPVVQAWIGDLVPDRRQLNLVLGNFNVLWTAGLMLGPLACGYLWGIHTLAPFVACTMITLLTALSLMTAPTRRDGTSDAALPTEHSIDRYDTRADFYMPLAWLANFASWYAGGAARTLFPKLGKEIGFSEVVIGWVMFAMLAGQLVAFLGLRRATWWHFRRLPLLVGLVIGALGMAEAARASTPLSFALALAVVGAANGFTYVASLFYSLQAPTSDRGRRAGIHEAIIGAGLATGPLVGGVLGSIYDLRLTFAAGALVFALVLLVEVALWVRHRACSPKPA